MVWNKKINTDISLKWIIYLQIFILILLFLDKVITENFRGFFLVSFSFFYGGISFSILKNNEFFTLKEFLTFGLLFEMFALIGIGIGALFYQATGIETIGIIGLFSYLTLLKITFDKYRKRYQLKSYLFLIIIFISTCLLLLKSRIISDEFPRLFLLIYSFIINLYFYFDLRKT